MSGGDVFTVGSLFSGIGGLELGLEMTGRFKTVWQAEQSEYCRKVLRKHWPEALQFEDVRNVGKENLPGVDVICGGFPCQDISQAGRQAGIVEGTRSGLWHEYIRIVREIRPSYVVVENVSALLVRGLDVVLGELAASGYDAEWSMLSAADVGAPHLRQRIFVIAYSHGGRRNRVSSDRGNGRTIPKERLQRIVRGSRSGEGDMANANESRLEGLRKERSHTQWDSSNGHPRSRSVGGIGSSERWAVEPNVGRVAHGVPNRVDRLRALGNAVVPQCAQVIGEWLLEIDAELNERGAA